MTTILVSGLLLCGCANSKDNTSKRIYNHSLQKEATEKEESLVNSDQIDINEDYLIVSINSADETMRVYRYDNNLEYQYYYGLNTRFLDKYGNYTSVANFQVGDIINISETDLSGKVTEVRKASDVWVYDEVSRFSINAQEGILEIADKNYRIDNDTYIFSGGEQTSVETITDQDKLSVVGIDKKILSISVTTGHGTLQLANTGLFEESYLQLNRNIFAMITENMEMELPEGVYTLVVANNGWGGSKEIEIKRNETTLVNLEEIKGEGPSYGEVMFVVDVDDAQIFIDDEQVDISAPVQLTYGAHSFEIVAEGYDKWKKTLYVNSPEATIELTLEDSDKSKADGSNTNNASQTDTGSGAGTGTTNNSNNAGGTGTTNNSNNTAGTGTTNTGNANNGNAGNSNSTGGNGTANDNNLRLDSISSDDLKDYLSTLSSLLDSL
ncbi:MAG: S-layer protein [Agathobacter sp.]|nr:S-layer protein [Agathobacter sp.]